MKTGVADTRCLTVKYDSSVGPFPPIIFPSFYVASVHVCMMRAAADCRPPPPLCATTRAAQAQARKSHLSAAQHTLQREQATHNLAAAQKAVRVSGNARYIPQRPPIPVRAPHALRLEGCCPAPSSAADTPTPPRPKPARPAASYQSKLRACVCRCCAPKAGRKQKEPKTFRLWRRPPHCMATIEIAAAEGSRAGGLTLQKPHLRLACITRMC